jgi:hypothetical protein
MGLTEISVFDFGRPPLYAVTLVVNLHYIGGLSNKPGQGMAAVRQRSEGSDVPLDRL